MSIFLFNGSRNNTADTHLLIPCSVVQDSAVGQLGTFEDGGLGRVTVHLTLQDGGVALAGLELGSVAEHSDALQGAPAGGVLVEAFAGLVLAGVHVLEGRSYSQSIFLKV